MKSDNTTSHIQYMAIDAFMSEYDADVHQPNLRIATRPLIFIPLVDKIAYYFHDLTKNSCELLSPTATIQTTYDYTPFGFAKQNGAVPLSSFTFSSEYSEDALALVYYNYRHYNPLNDNDAFGLSCCGETIYDAKTHCCVNDKDLIKKAKTCIAKIYLGHFGGRSVDETAKDHTFVTSAYITCFAKKMNEQREADGEIITPSHTGERTTTIVQPFPKPGTPPSSQVNVNLDKEIENAIWRLAELKDAGCCENIELEFLRLNSDGDDSSVNAWFNTLRNRHRMQTAKINLEKNVQRARNRIKKARRDK